MNPTSFCLDTFGNHWSLLPLNPQVRISLNLEQILKQISIRFGINTFTQIEKKSAKPHRQIVCIDVKVRHYLQHKVHLEEYRVCVQNMTQAQPASPCAWSFLNLAHKHRKDRYDKKINLSYRTRERVFWTAKSPQQFTIMSLFWSTKLGSLFSFFLFSYN